MSRLLLYFFIFDPSFDPFPLDICGEKRKEHINFLNEMIVHGLIIPVKLFLSIFP